MTLKTQPQYGFEDYAIYCRLPSLEEYVLVSQDQPLVEVFSRQSDGRWVPSENEGLDAEVVFASLGCRVAMREISDKVEFAHGDLGQD